MGGEEVFEKLVKLGFAELVLIVGLLLLTLGCHLFFDIFRAFHNLSHSVVKVCLSLKFTLELVSRGGIHDPFLHFIRCSFL